MRLRSYLRGKRISVLIVRVLLHYFPLFAYSFVGIIFVFFCLSLLIFFISFVELRMGIFPFVSWRCSSIPVIPVVESSLNSRKAVT